MTPKALQTHLSEAQRQGLPATLSLDEWHRTVADFAGLCAYCQERPSIYLEHFVPVRRGGGTTAGNCLPSCQSCNAKKGPLLVDGFAIKFGPERVSALRQYLAGRSCGPDVGRDRVAEEIELQVFRRQVESERRSRTKTLSTSVPAAEAEAFHAEVAKLKEPGSMVGGPITAAGVLREIVRQWLRERGALT